MYKFLGHFHHHTDTPEGGLKPNWERKTEVSYSNEVWNSEVVRDESSENLFLFVLGREFYPGLSRIPDSNSYRYDEGSLVSKFFFESSSFRQPYSNIVLLTLDYT